jgi:hypothetical protein
MSAYPEGRRPMCPSKLPGCFGEILRRGSKQCVSCYKASQKLQVVQKATETATIESVVEHGNTREMTKVTDANVRTLEDLVQVCNIDLDIWEVERWVANKWEVAMKPPATGKSPIWERPDATPVHRPLFQIKVWLRRRVVAIATRDEIAALKAQALEDAPRAPAIITLRNDSGYMFEPSIPDLHAGKLAWAKETGDANYDTKLARNAYEEALDTLLARTSQFKFEQIVLPVGNDLLNSDNLTGTTTSGTPQSTDVRFQKTFTTVRYMLVGAIERLRILAPVRIVMVPGNHDQLAVWHMGDSLDCYFHNYTDVVIDNTPRTRKYFQWGRVMLMFTHGDKGKKPDYPLVMATEESEMWSATQVREAHCGHIRR